MTSARYKSVALPPRPSLAQFQDLMRRYWRATPTYDSADIARLYAALTAGDHRPLNRRGTMLQALGYRRVSVDPNGRWHFLGDCPERTTPWISEVRLLPHDLAICMVCVERQLADQHAFVEH